MVGMGFGAEQFVANLGPVATLVGLPVLALSLVVSPIASELPECTTAFLWTRRGRDQLAFGNVAGAMVIQCRLPVAIGLAFSDWQLTAAAWVSAACAIAGVSTIFVSLLLHKALHPAYLLVNAALFVMVWALVLGHVVA